MLAILDLDVSFVNTSDDFGRMIFHQVKDEIYISVPSDGAECSVIHWKYTDLIDG